jgi:hypothetical protein
MAFVREFVRFGSAGLPARGVVLGLALALSACQSGDKLGALNIGGGGQSPASAEQETVTVEELTAYCPAITLGENRAVRNSYLRGGEGDAAKLVYRAAIMDTTRSCTYAGGNTSMTIGIAGRVIPGPAGTTGTVRLPLRLTVYQDTAEIHSQRFEHEVAITDTVGATQFVVIDRNFSMPNPTSRNVRVIVGFEEAPAR